MHDPERGSPASDSGSSVPGDSAPGDSASGRSLAVLLDEAEQMLRVDASIRREGAEVGRPSCDPTALMAEMEARIRTHPQEAARLAQRVGRVRAAHALQMREIPDEALRGLYADIRAGLAGDGAWLRAGMSEAFLDAPNALVLWRRLAVAACLLLAVGAGYLVPREDEAGTSESSMQVMELRELGFDVGSRSDSWSLGGVTPGSATRAAGVPARAETVAHGSPERPASRPGRMVWRVAGPRGPGQRGPGQRGPGQRGSGQRGSSQGGQVYLFRPADQPEDARRMLDGIRIFPIPGRVTEEGEEN